MSVYIGDLDRIILLKISLGCLDARKLDKNLYHKISEPCWVTANQMYRRNPYVGEYYDVPVRIDFSRDWVNPSIFDRYSTKPFSEVVEIHRAQNKREMVGR